MIMETESSCLEIEQKSNEEILHETITGDVSNVEETFLFEKLSLIELSRSSWYPDCKQINHNENKQTYLRGCKWSPDGTCCLTIVNNCGIHLLELPRELYQGDSISVHRPIDVLDSVVNLKENGLVYDYCWYPGMNSMVPESCCWLTTRQHAPIQMWDAFDGALRCSYRGYNAVDEVEAAISVCFSYNGCQIHAGYKKSIKTFNTDRPGRECVDQKIHSPASCLAVSPCEENLIAIGSWKTEISLYNIDDGKTKSIAKLRGHSGGVTHLQFLPDGTKLVSGARKDSKLLVWDIRFHKCPYKILHRKVETNQRIYFDTTKCGKYLASGGTDGIVNIWDLSKEQSDSTYVQHAFPLHNDCCNGVSIHPYRPIMATCSGQHHTINGSSMEDVSDSEDHSKNIIVDRETSSPLIKPDEFKIIPEIDDVIKETLNSDVKLPNVPNTYRQIENCLQFWWAGKSVTDDKEI